MKRCAVILARGGSKGIPRKNLQELNGRALVWYPISAALGAEEIGSEDVYVSTDDQEIAKFARHHGAKVIDRPEQISGDLNTDWEAMRHFLGVVHADYDYIVHLRPTFPCITSFHVDQACRQFEDSYDGYDSLRSVVRTKHTPYKMWHIDDHGRLVSIVAGNTLHSSPRQIIPPAYEQNAAIDIVKSWVVVNLRSMTGDRIMPYLMKEGDDGIDIDTWDDLQRMGSDD